METVNIYKISSSLTHLVYIGSTCQKLNRRLKDHRQKYKLFLKGKYGYCGSYDIIKLEDCKIELLEVCDVAVRSERERWWVENTENATNKRMPGRKLAEYLENNKDKTTKKFSCECGGKYTHANKLQHFKTKKHLVLLALVA